MLGALGGKKKETYSIISIMGDVVGVGGQGKWGCYVELGIKC